MQRLDTARAVEGPDWVRRRQQDFAGSAVRTMVTTQLLMALDRERERAGRLLAAGEPEGAVLAARVAVGTAVDAVLAARGMLVAEPGRRVARLRRPGPPPAGPGPVPDPPAAADYWRLETMRDLDPDAPAGWVSAALLFCARSTDGLQP